jgi:hypothetical protein
MNYPETYPSVRTHIPQDWKLELVFTNYPPLREPNPPIYNLQAALYGCQAWKVYIFRKLVVHYKEAVRVEIVHIKSCLACQRWGPGGIAIYFICKKRRSQAINFRHI